ncbi:AAA-associated domain-containing protein [Candidatus Bipolaricaulota bacterium]|nr:AAA-associated domain-containing protein [Candidatus Bipolaricaulota bacterium]
MGTIPIVELKRVSQIYGSGKRRFTAIQGVNLLLYEGEFVALVGPSGCGKSTLLRIITGLERPSAGQVLYRGEPVRGVNPRATIVFQTFALFPWLTVQGNVEVALAARRVPEKERVARALDLLDRVGLDGFEGAYPRELSGGMRQKVGFARAMAVEPELLCMDEPFSALDVLSGAALRGDLLELWTSGKIPTKAILMVTHNIEEAVVLADRIVVMDKDPGRIVAELAVGLPHPRRQKDPRFAAVVDQVYAALAGQTQPEHVELGSAPGGPGRPRALPDVTVGAIAGLLEQLAQAPGGRADLYRLSEDLKLGSDQLLRATEAVELLGFATVAQGDITLTPLGETFAEAGILVRKEMFASRIRRLPIFRWLLDLLGVAEDGRLRREVVERALELEFPQDVADRQIETIVNWGRYAEVLAYDDAAEVLYLEPAGTSATAA